MEEKDRQTKTGGRRGTKPSKVPVVTAVTRPGVTYYLRSKDRKKSRKRFDKPLMTGSTVVSAAGHSSQLGDANRIDEAGEAQKIADQGTPASKEVVHEWNGSLPFTKSSPIWKAIESMDVFHRFPQNPHFLPLGDLGQDFREGFAVSHMANFASTVDKAFKLNITDHPAEDINTCIDTLQVLEEHGFDVAAVKDHLKRMLLIKEAQEKLQEKKKEVDNRAVELSYENSEVDGEILELKEKLKRLQEELASAKSKKGEKLSEIVFLKGKSASISQLIDEASLNIEDPAEYNLKAAPFLPLSL